MNTTLEPIRAATAAAETEKNRAYLQLVRDTAAGAEVDPDEAAAVLAACGKDVADLERDAATEAERIRIRAELDRLPDLKKHRKQLQTTIDAAYAALEAARVEYDLATRPAADQICAIDAALREQGRLRLRLTTTCLDTEAVAAWNEAKARLGRATQERDRLRPALRDMREKATVSEGLARDAAHADRAEQHRAAAERQNRLADEYEGRLGELKGEIERLEAAERKAREAVERS